MLQAPIRFLVAALLFVPPVVAQTNTTLLVSVDHRPAVSLNGEWHAVVDQYATGLYDFHQNLRSDGFFMNAPFDPNGHPQDYNFAIASTLRVPGDWNTQRPELFYYEGSDLVREGLRSHYRRRTPAPSFTSAPRTIAPSSGSTLRRSASTRAASLPSIATSPVSSRNGRTSSSSRSTTPASPTASPRCRPTGGTMAASPATSRSSTFLTQFIDDYDLHLSRADHEPYRRLCPRRRRDSGTSVTVTIPELHARQKPLSMRTPAPSISIPVKIPQPLVTRKSEAL